MRQRLLPAANRSCPLPPPFTPLQLQQSSDWLDMVDRAYESLDRDGCGRIGPKDLEELLCGDGGCEVRLLSHGCRLAAARSLCFGSVPALQWLQPVLAELPAALPPPHRRPPTGWTWCCERRM